jgi:hypothetical protein
LSCNHHYLIIWNVFEYNNGGHLRAGATCKAEDGATQAEHGGTTTVPEVDLIGLCNLLDMDALHVQRHIRRYPAFMKQQLPTYVVPWMAFVVATQRSEQQSLLDIT